MIFGLQALAFRILQLPPMEYGTQAAPELPSTEPTQDKAVSLLSFLLYRLISDLDAHFPPENAVPAPEHFRGARNKIKIYDRFYSPPQRPRERPR